MKKEYSTVSTFHNVSNTVFGVSELYNHAFAEYFSLIKILCYKNQHCTVNCASSLAAGEVIPNVEL